MTPEEICTYINAQTACMLAEMYGMVADNEQRLHRGESMAWMKEDFVSLAEKYCLTHNQIISQIQATH